MKAWLYEHRKNPYPTKGEKIMLAIITKMTLTQVSTWFANARRRLKKESKLGYKERDIDGSDVESIGSPAETDDGECYSFLLHKVSLWKHYILLKFVLFKLILE